MTTGKREPIHPGEILLEEFLKPMNVTPNRLALAIKVPPRRINEIVHKARAVTPDTALRLGKFFGMEPEFWARLQMTYDLELAKDAKSEALAAIETIHPAA